MGVAYAEFIRGHADELLAARIAAVNGLPDAVAAAADHLRSVLTDYLAGAGAISEVLTAAGRDNRIVGQGQATAFRRSLDDVATLPVPRPMFQPEAASLGSFDNPTAMQVEPTQEGRNDRT